MEHKHTRWFKAKRELMKDFQAWINECRHTRENNAQDMIEFLYQQGFIRGKQWRKYIDKIADNTIDFRRDIIDRPALEEGKLHPDTWVGGKA